MKKKLGLDLYSATGIFAAVMLHLCLDNLMRKLQNHRLTSSIWKQKNVHMSLIFWVLSLRDTNKGFKIFKVVAVAILRNYDKSSIKISSSQKRLQCSGYLSTIGLSCQSKWHWCCVTTGHEQQLPSAPCVLAWGHAKLQVTASVTS